MNAPQFEKCKYPDKSIYAKMLVEPSELYSEILVNINSYEDLWYLSCIKDLYNFHKVPLSIVIPCLWEQQADRRFSDKESFGLKQVVDFINNLKFEKVTLFHPHNASVELALNNCHIINNTAFIKKVLEELDYNDEEIVLLSPDGGAIKWIYKLADELNFKGEIVSAGKFRNHETKELTQVLDKQDFGGKHVVIVDDMCLYGGTFLGLASLLKTRNIGKLYLAVSHITVENPNPKLQDEFAAIYTTNSKYSIYGLDNIRPIKLF